MLSDHQELSDVNIVFVVEFDECYLLLFQLEKKLTYREEQLLEKELIHEQVNRLSEKLKARSDTGKTDTLALAKKVST